MWFDVQHYLEQIKLREQIKENNKKSEELNKQKKH